jgi:hypothetical protein
LHVQPVYGFASGTKDAARFLQAAGHADLWFLEDREVPFQQVLRLCICQFYKPSFLVYMVLCALCGLSVVLRTAALLKVRRWQGCARWYAEIYT